MSAKSPARRCHRLGVAAACVAFVLAIPLPVIAGQPHVPVGAPLPGLRFDATIELFAPVYGSRIALFARYWVTTSSFRTEVVWAEPHWGAINFAYYPVSLYAESDTDEFLVGNWVRKKQWRFKKPLGDRKTFAYRFNSYHVGGTRLAEPEAARSRVPRSWLQGVGPDALSSDAPVRIQPVDGQRLSGPVAALWRDGRLHRLDFSDANGRVWKSVEYLYTKAQGRPVLHKRIVSLSERPIPVKAITAKIVEDGRKSTHTLRGVPYHQGGRRCVVEYGRVELGDRTLQLPVRIDVFSQHDNVLLRRALLSDFQALAGDAEKAVGSPDAVGYSAFSDDERSWRALLIRNWVRPPAQVSAKDRRELDRLARVFEVSVAKAGSAAQEVKRLNMLCMVALMRGDDASLRRWFRAHLQCLAKAGVPRVALDGGAKLLELTVRWQKPVLASELVPVWAGAALASNRADAAVEFAGRWVAASHFWLPYQLLVRLQQEADCDAQLRLNVEYQMCRALAGIVQSMADAKKKPADHLAREIAWVTAQKSPAELRRLLKRHLGRAYEQYGRLEEDRRATHRNIRGHLDWMAEHLLDVSHRR